MQFDKCFEQYRSWHKIAVNKALGANAKFGQIRENMDRYGQTRTNVDKCGQIGTRLANLRIGTVQIRQRAHHYLRLSEWHASGQAHHKRMGIGRRIYSY